MTFRGLHLLASAVILAAIGVGAGVAEPPVPLEQLVGRRLVVAMQGTPPSSALIERVTRGEIAGVVLFRGNVRSKAQVRSLTGALQAAARNGGHAPLLIATDQEGGIVRRLVWAPPVAAAEELGRRPSASLRDVGRQTGLALRRVGINVDLAPVADVPAVPGSFVAAQRRAFSPSPDRAGLAVTAFALGLGDARVAATLKHFPGLGRAVTSTDVARVSIDGTRAQLERGILPFAAAIRARAAPLVMLSSAAYPAYGVTGSAAWSPAMLARLRALGFEGATMTDALEALSRTHHRPLAATALLCIRSGVDLVLFAGSEASTDRVFRSLVAAARTGVLSRAALQVSAARVDRLARSLSP